LTHMSGDNDKEKKGFSGLSDLASGITGADDVAHPKPSPPPPRPSQPTSTSTANKETERKASGPPQPTETVGSGKSGGGSAGKGIYFSPFGVISTRSGKSGGGSGVKWILGIFAAILFVIWLANNGEQSRKKTSYNPPAPSQTYNSPQSSSPTVSTLDASKLNKKAESLLKSDKYLEGLKILNKAVEVDPGYAVAYYNRGWTYCHLKQYSKAIVDYDKAIELYPNYVSAYFMRGWTYSRLKQYTRAIQDFDRAIELDPVDAVAYQWRGLVYILRGRTNQGCADLQKACDLGVCDYLEKAVEKGKCPPSKEPAHPRSRSDELKMTPDKTIRGKLFVKTDPKNSRVRILNIKPKFYQGIELGSGRYHVEVSNTDYKTKKMWVKLEAGENKQLEIRLEQLQSSIQPTTTYTRPLSTPDVIKRDGIYVAYANGIVRDTKTGLEWKVGPDKNINWNEARSWVQNLNFDGGGWRMPTMDELEDLYKKGAGKRNMTPLLETTGWWVWSGETKDSSKARFFNCYSGDRSFIYRDHSDSARAFAVRSRGDG